MNSNSFLKIAQPASTLPGLKSCTPSLGTSHLVSSMPPYIYIAKQTEAIRNECLSSYPLCPKTSTRYQGLLCLLLILLLYPIFQKSKMRTSADVRQHEHRTTWFKPVLSACPTSLSSLPLPNNSISEYLCSLTHSSSSLFHLK